MPKWEYATVPLLVHATKQILDNWGQDGWELVTVDPGPERREQLVAYLKRPAAVSALAHGWPSSASSCPTVAAAGGGVRAGGAHRQPRLHLRPAAVVDGGCADRQGRRRGRREADAKDAARAARSTRWPRSTPWSGLDRWSGWSRWSASSPARPGFTGQPGVINGASELLGEVFGDAGRARPVSAVGVAELPLDAPVEVELIVEVR